MNLAAALYAADVQLEAVKNEIEHLLTALCPAWVSWEFIKPSGISVYGAFEAPRAAAVLASRGFVSAQFHDHRAGEQVISCRCRVFEVG